jgi:RimJ/RimL family protein N-acetyltransferase
MMNSAPPVLVDTPRFRGRGVRPTDATAEIAGWFADPARVGPLNLPPRQLTIPELRRFLDTFYNRSRFLIALIEKDSDRLCGFLHAEFSPLHRLSRISFLSGATDTVARRAVLALSPPLIATQFNRYGIEKIVAQVLTTNTPICALLHRLGFRREGYLNGQVRSPDGSGRLDQVLFGLLASDWRAARTPA